MLTKIAALLQTKAAVAVLGAVLVGGAGTAAAVTATTHEVPFTQIHVGANAEETPGANNDGEHHNEVGIEGVLTAYDAKTFKITVQTTGAKTEGTDGTEATATSATETPEHASDAKPTTTTAPVSVTVTVNANTRVNGDHAKSLADLSANIGHKVEVQAEKQSDGTLVASKVTVSNDVGESNGKGGNDGKGGSDGNDKHGEGTPSPQNTDGHGGSQSNEDASGTVSMVGTDSFQFTLRDSGKTLIVSVSAATTFSGTVHNLSEVKVGYNVEVKGTLQSNGTLAATSVSSEGSHS